MIKIIEEKDDAEKHLHVITLSFDKDEVNKAKDVVEKKLAEDIEIKGFRKGKAPIEEARKYINADKLLTGTVDKLGSYGYEWLLGQYYNDKDEQIKPLNFFIERPKTDLLEFKADETKINYTFDLFPTVSIDLNDLKLTVSNELPTDEEVQQRINQDLESNATLEPKKDGEPVENGDVAVFDFEGRINGEAFEGGAAKLYELEIGSHRFIAGFEEQLVGMKPNEERDIKVTFPKDYPAPKLQGKEANFHVVMHQVKKVNRPAYNDEFIKSLNIHGVENDAQLRDHYKMELAEQKQTTYHDNAMREISDQLVKNCKISYIPEFLVKSEIGRIHAQMDQTLKQYNIKLEDYLKMTNRTQEELDKDFEKEARQVIILDIAVSQVAKDNHINVTPDEVSAEMKKLEEQYNPEHKKEMTERIEQSKGLISAQLIQQKVYDFLFDMLSKKQKDERAAANATDKKEEAPAKSESTSK